MDPEKARLELMTFVNAAHGRMWTDDEARRVDELRKYVKVDTVGFVRGALRVVKQEMRKRDDVVRALTARVEALELRRAAADSNKRRGIQ